MKATELYFFVILFIMLFYVASVKGILGCDHSNEYGARHNVSYVPFITLHKAVLNSNSVDLILPMAMVRPLK